MERRGNSYNYRITRMALECHFDVTLGGTESVIMISGRKVRTPTLLMIYLLCGGGALTCAACFKALNIG